LPTCPGHKTSGTQGVPALPQQSGAPGLKFKTLEGEDNIYSARIGLEYRALAVVKKDRVVWFWIGNHSDYDRLV